MNSPSFRGGVWSSCFPSAWFRLAPELTTQNASYCIHYEGHTTQLVQKAVKFRGQSPQSKARASHFYKFHLFFLIYTNNNEGLISVREFTGFGSVRCDFIFIGIKSLPLSSSSRPDTKSLNHGENLAFLPGKYQHSFLDFHTLRLF
jgi:hypothetical protein